MTNRNIKWLLALLLCAVMALGLGMAHADSVSLTYTEYSWNGSELVENDVYVHTAKHLFGQEENLAGGVYYVDILRPGNIGTFTTEDHFTLQGDVTLILCDGATFNCKGFYVPEGMTLKIVAAGNGTGRLVCDNTEHGAGIGGDSGSNNGNIEIHGGVVEAYGHGNCAGIGTNDGKTGGTITIYGGTVTAEGGSNGAGIGGGRNCSGGVINIYGGTVTGIGGEDGAGIGGGENGDGGTISIYGGTVTANGPSDSVTPEDGAGIGGGLNGDGGTIHIYGGTVNAYSRDGAGIGGGDNGDGGSITISGGHVTSTKVNQGQGARIGGGCDGAPGTILIEDGYVTTVGGSGAGLGGGKGNKAGGSVTISGGVINASGSYGIGKGDGGSNVNVTLTYTDATKDSICINASSFNGTVTMEKSFGKAGEDAWAYPDPIFSPGVVVDNSLLTGGDLRGYDIHLVWWHVLQKAINGASAGATITLERDLTAGAGDSALYVPSGWNLTIDLNGHTLDRGLADGDAQADGYVIKNEGTLTIIDSAGGGTITGGNCSDRAGGVYNSGTLTLNGGSITGNKSATWGGGIYLPDGTGAVLNLNGGTVTNNTCGNNGGGVHVSGTATLNVSGSPVVSGNKKGSAANNIYLAGNAVMQVTGALTEGADLRVRRAGNTGVITGGYGAKMGSAYPDAYLHSDNTSYTIALVDGEAQIATPLTVSVDAEAEGRLTVDKTSARPGDTVTVTVLDGTAISMISAVWAADGTTHYDPLTAGTGNTATFTMPGADVTVKINPPVTYYENGSKTYNGNYTVVTSDTTTWTSGWYVVNDNVTINQRIEVTGNVKLLIMGVDENNYCDLIANGGIHVPSGKSLTIYGGTKEEGGLRVNNVSMNNAGIGGNSGETNGAITIYSGAIVCSVKEDSNGAGIGGGKNGNGTNITINSGAVISMGIGYGAGIGGGLGGDGSNITINGGSVLALSYYGAGIGGGDGGEGYRLQFHGGGVYAQSYDGAGIGGGAHAIGYGITVTGGSVTATSDQGAGVGAGINVPGGDWTIFDDLIKVTGGRLMARCTDPTGGEARALIYGNANKAFYVGHLSFAVSIYYGARVWGGSSESSMRVKGLDGAIDDNYVLIEPCTHENATYEVISDETHLEQCEDCNTEFTEEPHTFGADGVCAVCGYDSHSSYVFFDSAGGSDVEAQLIANGGTATRPEDPTWAGHTFDAWYLVTDPATGAHETTAFNFSTQINASITLIAGWNHAHDDISFTAWNATGSLPTEAGSYYLNNDVTLTSPWTFSAGTMNLCLNGHTVTGNIQASSDAVLNVTGGTLSLYDEAGGTITQTSARVNTVYVASGGALILHGGTITGAANAANDPLTGVYAEGSFTMTGGTVTGNYRGVSVHGAFTVSGGARVAGNTDIDVQLNAGQKIHIGGALTANALFDVYAVDGACVFTDGLNGNGDLSDFSSEGNTLLLGLNADGEAVLGAARMIVFAPGDNDATGTMEAVTVASGSVYELPACDFAVAGKDFTGWLVGNATAPTAAGESITVNADTTLTAAWEGLGQIIVTLVPGEAAGETVTLSSLVEANWTDDPSHAEGKFISGINRFCLPENPYTVPEGKLFAGWKLDGDDTVYAAGYYMDLGSYTLTAQFANAHTVTFADMPSFASWMGGGAAQTAAAGTTINLYVLLGSEEYAAGTRLSALRVTGAGVETLTITEDVQGNPLASADFSAIPGSALYVARFTLPDADVTVTAVWQYPAFGTPDFEIPTDVTAIEANAFEGIAATVVRIPENCESVGDYAFRDCTGLTMIRIPAECALGTDVFDGCTKVYVFGIAGSPAEAYCHSHSNCVFVPEGQN